MSSVWQKTSCPEYQNIPGFPSTEDKLGNLIIWFERIFEIYFNKRPKITIENIENQRFWRVKWHNLDCSYIIGPICYDYFSAVYEFEMAEFDASPWDLNLTGSGHVHFPVSANRNRKNTPLPLTVTKSEIALGFDLLGFLFWCFCRVEELGSTDRDEHGRFTAKQSHAARYGYLDYPIIDRWMDFLHKLIRRHWPQLNFQRCRPSFLLSHDVDWPSRYAFASAKKFTKRLASDILVHGKIDMAIKAPVIRLRHNRCLADFDDHNNFDWIMSQAEKSGLQSCFYFIATNEPSRFDGDYKISHPAIGELMQQIHARGHLIGLHPSYESHISEKAAVDEAVILRRHMEINGIRQDLLPSRMHYLRWDQSRSPKYLADLGVTTDASLGYSDQVGFRCGTSYEFPAFDPLSMSGLPFNFQPLIVMDTTIFDHKYMAMNSEEGFLLLKKMQQESQSCGGNFSILWHNNNLVSSIQKDLFRRVLEQ